MTLNRKEQRRLIVLNQVETGKVIGREAAECRPSAIMGHKRGYENRTVGGGVSSV